jgi:mono/diheme cytochrome c family protein
LESRSIQPQNSLLQQAVTKLVVFLLLAVFGWLCWSFFPHNTAYSQQVLASNGDPTLGHAIFQMNCSGCHGLEAQGRVGPNLHAVAKRKSSAALIEQVTSGNTPPMPQFQPSIQEMADLLSYLKTL